MRLLFCSICSLCCQHSPLWSTFPFVGQHFICQQSRLNEMKLFKLRTIAFSYSDYVDLYCLDKGETLHIHNPHVHFRLHRQESLKVINSVFKPWLCTLSCAAFVEYQIRDTVASFPIGTKYAQSEIWYRIWKTLNFYKLCDW